MIEPDDIIATLESQGSPLEQGDVLLMRTGWTEWYESETDEEARRVRRSGPAEGTRTAVGRANGGVPVGSAHRRDRCRQPGRRGVAAGHRA